MEPSSIVSLNNRLLCLVYLSIFLHFKTAWTGLFLKKSPNIMSDVLSPTRKIHSSIFQSRYSELNIQFVSDLILPEQGQLYCWMQKTVKLDFTNQTKMLRLVQLAAISANLYLKHCNVLYDNEGLYMHYNAHHQTQRFDSTRKTSEKVLK